MTPEIYLPALLLLALVLPPVLETTTTPHLLSHTSPASISDRTPPHAVPSLPEPISERSTHGDWYHLHLAENRIANGSSEGITYPIEQSLRIDSAVKDGVRIEQASPMSEKRNHPTMTALSAPFIATFPAAPWTMYVYFHNAKNRSIGAIKRALKKATGSKNAGVEGGCVVGRR
jgi:hypothetical protein